MKKQILKILKPIALAMPLLSGLVGFLYAGLTFADALFDSISLYAMNFQDTPPNLWVEVGRWTAPLATASGIFLAVSALRSRVQNFLCYRRGDSVAVYGPEVEKAALLGRLGGRGMDGRGKYVRAARYILLGEEEENYDFYASHRQELEKREVYLRCSSLPSQAGSLPGLHLFCPEETAARLFWKEYCPYGRSVERADHLKIVLLGCGKLGEELLEYALLNNIFSPDQRIQYHVFGEEDGFLAVHSRLGEIGDPVVFHGGPWYEELSLLEEADMVVVLTQEGQLALLQKLLLATCREEIVVFASGSAGLELLAGRERLLLFPWQEYAQCPEHILSDVLFGRAKGLNLRYAHLYDGVPETAQAGEELWQKLDAFTRYSNVSAADYHEVRLAMLRAWGVQGGMEGLSPEQLEQLAELEHIRWCRYHYLHNWQGGIPENGKNKDPRHRIHRDLRPYKELGEADREKDRENIRVLMDLDLF